MAIREVLRMGHPVLSRIAQPLEAFGTPELSRLLQDMVDTMAHEDGAGLAAPQIGESVRLVIFGVTANPRYPDAEEVPFTVLANPFITSPTQQIELGWEGCVSGPGLRGVVPRRTRLRYTGFDELGRPIDRIAEGFHARVVQHECDHLDGILYPMRMPDMSQFGFTDVLFPGDDPGPDD